MSQPRELRFEFSRVDGQAPDSLAGGHDQPAIDGANNAVHANIVSLASDGNLCGLSDVGVRIVDVAGYAPSPQTVSGAVYLVGLAIDLEMENRHTVDVTKSEMEKIARRRKKVTARS
jgi:hypothetical protein